MGLAARAGVRRLLQRGSAESAAVSSRAGAHDGTIVLVPRAVSKRAADGAEHRRGRVQPAGARRSGARGRFDRRPAVPRERAAVCRRSAARRDEPCDARMAAADQTGARSADDDRGSGRRGDRAGASGRAVNRARTGRRTLAHRPRRARHARAGIHRRWTAHRSRSVASRARAIGRARRCALRSTAARQGLDEARRSITSLRRSPLENRLARRGARRAVAPLHGRDRSARPAGHCGGGPASGGRRIRAVPDRRRGADERAKACPCPRGVSSARRGPPSGAPDHHGRRAPGSACAACARPRVRPVGH